MEASGEAEALRRAHATYMMALASRAEPYLRGTQARHWLDRLEHDHDNLRAALGWARDAGETTFGLQLAGTLKEYWYGRGYIGEGLTWLMAVIETQGATLPSDTMLQRIRAKALSAAGVLALWHTDYVAACSFLESCATLARAAGMHAIAAEALHRLSLAVYLKGDDPKRALEIVEEGVALARAQADLDTLAGALSNLGYLCYHLGDLERSAASLREGLALARQAGDSFSAPINLMQLGQVARRQGDPRRARPLLEEALQLACERGDPRLIAETIEYLADTAAEAGLGQRTARLLGAAAKLREPIGFPQVPIDQAETESLVAPVRAALGEAAWMVDYEAGRALSLEQAIAEALKDDA